MIETISSDHVRQNWGDTVTSVIRGDTRIIARYNKPFAVLVPFEKWQEAQRLLKLAKIDDVLEQNDFVTEQEFEQGLKERGLI